MKTAVIIASAAGLAAAQFSYNETTGKYTCAQPNQAYCVAGSMESNIILRCDNKAIGQPGNCNDNLDGEPPMGNTYSPCWQTSNTTGDAACSKNCVVYGGSGNFNGTFTLPADSCTPTYTATSSAATTTATTLTQSVTVSTSSVPASGTGSTAVGTGTTILCTETESESSTASTGAVTGSPPSTTVTSAASASATTIIPPPASPPSSNNPSGAGSPPPGGSTAFKPSNTGPGPVVTSTSTSTSSLTAVSTTSFPTAGAASNHVGVGLGVVGLIVGAML
ncbi:hypothetical protein INS49_012613 [Diaporthe citri]|uniref:uncharacterized protein n=1 Tax=Diaporthe citri TaxID=83186 RepID=UPI001C815782|nr:uncharacterized protein INS49_012613 [Diaporthe citri]KAG6359093.1 hypothetical protein INS49_012613 [Diaporthe citri]